MENRILSINPNSFRNIRERLLTILSALFAFLAVLPLVLVLSYVLIKGGSYINWQILFLEPEPPGDDLLSAGGIGPAVLGTAIMSFLSLITKKYEWIFSVGIIYLLAAIFNVLASLNHDAPLAISSLVSEIIFFSIAFAASALYKSNDL